jgi:hypothetical protein
MSKLRPDVERMLENEGLYLAFDPNYQNAIVPIVSQSGKLLTMRIDCEISPEKFFDRTTLHGPFLTTEANEIKR